MRVAVGRRGTAPLSAASSARGAIRLPRAKRGWNHGGAAVLSPHWGGRTFLWSGAVGRARRGAGRQSGMREVRGPHAHGEAIHPAHRLRRDRARESAGHVMLLRAVWRGEGMALSALSAHSAARAARANAHASNRGWRVRALLDEAADVLPEDPDAAALLLDGALWRIVALWYRHRGERVPAPRAALADLAARGGAFGWHVRLALRAPDARARLEHCRVLAGLAAT